VTAVKNHYSVYSLDVFWDDEFKHLEYIQEPFNDPDAVQRWLIQGYQPKFCGDLADMRHRLPSWNHRFIEHFQNLGWQDIGCAYYRMTSGTVMPVHQDRYVKYIDLFDLQHRESTIRRALVLLEDWQSGHYLEVACHPFVNWQAGTVVEWRYDTPHMAANVGLNPRYTLQITGHVNAVGIYDDSLEAA
jgi:hypothetical protein